MTERSEKAILNDSLIAVTAIEQTMAWRNNTGMAWQGEQRRVGVGSMVRVERGMVVLVDARPIRFGLPGSPDILGLTCGRFFGLETKTRSGRQSDEQKAFARAVVAAGGQYELVRAVEDAVAVPLSLLQRE